MSSVLSWRSKGLLSVSTAIIAGGVILGFGPMHRQFDLFRANLSGQWLVLEDLHEANLRLADLRDAVLFSANSSGATLLVVAITIVFERKFDVIRCLHSLAISWASSGSQKPPARRLLGAKKTRVSAGRRPYPGVEISASPRTPIACTLRALSSMAVNSTSSMPTPAN